MAKSQKATGEIVPCLATDLHFSSSPANKQFSFFQQTNVPLPEIEPSPKLFIIFTFFSIVKASGEKDTYVGGLLGIGTGLRTGLALGRTSNIPPTATPPLGGPLNRKLT
jgi:hypothetical protein